MYISSKIIVFLLFFSFIDCFTNDEILKYRNKVKDMFYHAYNSYLENAFDFDELKPLSCEGTNTWGNFHLTLIDSLDTLIIMKNYTEFNRIVKFIIENINFDYDLNVSVFETNIRIIGGLLSAHLLSFKTGIELEEYWPCDGPLLRLAEKMARKLLPAFDTKTKMPIGTVNLLNGVPFNETTITCSACIGTFILEFGTLSRLTGDEIFERTALEAIKSLHESRSSIDLLGNHINVTDSAWIAIESSIGGAIDSYFEYLVKGSIYLQIPQLFDFFNIYLNSIRKYMKRDDWHFSVNMHTGQITNPSFQSLEAFWPGLLTLIGHLDEAKRIFLNNHQIWKELGFLPEFYDVTGEVKRNGYPLRPEHIESIFYLFKSTKDLNYLNYAVDVLESIEYSTRTDCGYASVKDVISHMLEDRMESFMLGETLKYLYLLFDHTNFIYNDGNKGVEIYFKNRSNQKITSCIIDTSYIFNTEAHPFDPSILYCCSKNKLKDEAFINQLANSLNYKSVLENSLLDNLIKPETEPLKEQSLSDEILNNEFTIDGIDCELELNRNLCLKLELEKTNYSHCSPTPFLFKNFANLHENLGRESN